MVVVVLKVGCYRWWWWWCRGRFLISSFSIVSNTPNASYSSWYAFSLSLTVNIMSKNSLNPSSPSEFRSHFEDVKFCQKRLLPCAKSHLLRLQLLFYLEYALSMFEALNGLGWFTTWNQRRKWPSFHKLSIKIETCFFFFNPCGYRDQFVMRIKETEPDLIVPPSSISNESKVSLC